MARVPAPDRSAEPFLHDGDIEAHNPIGDKPDDIAEDQRVDQGNDNAQNSYAQLLSNAQAEQNRNYAHS